MAKCLVTGASGFIGTHLVRALVERGDQVTCLVRRTSNVANLDGLPVQIAQGDVTDQESLAAAVKDCDAVYHLAGLTKALSFDALMDVNSHGVERLLRACAAASTPPVAVLVSSLAAAGPAIEELPVKPGDACRPISNYGRSKLAGEISAACRAHEVPITIIRPPIVIGEGDHMTLDLFHTVSSFRVHPVPGFRARRASVIHASDLARAMILAFERGQRLTPAPVGASFDELVRGGAYPVNGGQGIYYPADAETPTFAEIGQMIARGLGRKGVLVIPTAEPAVWTAAALAELAGRIVGKPFSLNLDKAREATAGSWICSPHTANNELEFVPGETLGDRFRQTAQWYLKEGWL